MRKIIVVGQTPPPYGGQAIMIEKILDGTYDGVKLFHVRMSFSKEMNEIGKASFSKVLHLVKIIFMIYYTRIFKNADILYYPPAGPDKTPVIRDIVILVLTRWLFKKTIFHFHAGGVSDLKLNSALLRFLYRRAYYNADCAILLSELNPADGENLYAKRQIIIPYGIEDNTSMVLAERPISACVKILFVAIIKETKGILVLLEACRTLSQRGISFQLDVMGKFESQNFEQRVHKLIGEYNIQDNVRFLGVLSGIQKFTAFQNADIFCFPTFFESETFGVVLLEAMQFSLPVVATSWRGIPSIIKEGENGFLVPPQNSDMLAQKLEMLILDPVLRKKLGKNGRERYLVNYSLPIFVDRMGEIFRNC